jgi:hypothetical protein
LCDKCSEPRAIFLADVSILRPSVSRLKRVSTQDFDDLPHKCFIRQLEWLFLSREVER